MIPFPGCKQIHAHSPAPGTGDGCMQDPRCAAQCVLLRVVCMALGVGALPGCRAPLGMLSIGLLLLLHGHTQHRPAAPTVLALACCRTGLLSHSLYVCSQCKVSIRFAFGRFSRDGGGGEGEEAEKSFVQFRSLWKGCWWEEIWISRVFQTWKPEMWITQCWKLPFISWFVFSVTKGARPTWFALGSSKFESTPLKNNSFTLALQKQRRQLNPKWGQWKTISP